MEMRQIRGMEIARQKSKAIKPVKDGWLVQSQSDKDRAYKVNEEFDCDCPDSQFHKKTCNQRFRPCSRVCLRTYPKMHRVSTCPRFAECETVLRII